MNFGFLGIQFGFALQNANASRILQTFGADIQSLSWFWVVAPLTGMIIQPLIGHYSDRTWCKLGRRKPYFLTGAILAAIALLFMPNSAALSSLLPPLIIGAGMLTIMNLTVWAYRNEMRIPAALCYRGKKSTNGDAPARRRSG